MTNLPIKRFADFLYRRNELEVKYFFIKGSLRDFFKDFTSSIPFDVHIRHCNLKILLSDMSNCFQMHARERCMANGSFKDGLIEAKMKLVIIFHSHICAFFHHSFFHHFKAYMQLLVENFNPKTLDGLMCRNSLSIDYKGRLFDCDFNQVSDHS